MTITDADNDAYQSSEWLVFIEKLENFIEAIIQDKISYDGNYLQRMELRNDIVSYLVEKGISAP